MPFLTLPARKDIPETSIYYETVLEAGSRVPGEGGRPVCLFLPGGPGGNSSVYLELKDKLLPHADLVFWDPRGCGKSQESDAKFCTIQHYIDDTKALTDALELTQPIMISGSYGAMAGLGFAIHYPDNLAALVCIAGASHGGFIDKARENLVAVGATPEQVELANKLFSGSISSHDEMMRFYQTLMPLYVASEEAKAAVAEKLAEPPTTTAATSFPIHIANAGYGTDGFLRGFDWRPRLHEITVPTLILQGDKDWINDPCFAEETAKGISAGPATAELAVLENCGHFQWRDQYDAFLDKLTGFVESAKPSHRESCSP